MLEDVEGSDVASSAAETLRPRLGVSRCLLGENVRVNGGHCQSKWILNVLGEHAEFVGVCPEVELGLPTPRPPMRLVVDASSEVDGAVRLQESKSGDDWTAPMAEHVGRRAEELALENLDGFIFKKDSPTCGVFRVKVYDHNGSPSSRGRGVFAEALMARLPNLPVEEEGRLNDPLLRESFLVRVHAYARWRRYLDEDASLAGLGTFHARHKMLLLAADPSSYRRLGQLVAGHAKGGADLATRLAEYEAGLMLALANVVSRGRHVNVIQHLVGFCKTELASEEKRELQRNLDLYTQGVLPRAAPVAIVRYLLLKHEAAPWAREQHYLDPYPARLAPAPVA
ncbi:MAG: DUF523 and DUF1722 domain-containing protein [Planctomycetota bacterium]|nr:DUF523 and DUF1722 domain-containing protein [Planctomycetota bacterium]